jgi:catechol 2,3-dioxygenase-like lactoylglutathione lyase family enzyme
MTTTHDTNPTALVAGLNHVAILTADLDRIAAFYTHTLGATRVDVPVPPGAEGAAIVRLGPTAGIAFVQAAGHPHAAGSTAEMNRGHLDHVALEAGSSAALAEVRQRLIECDASDGAIRDYGSMLCVSFTDPDGMGSEICWIRDPSLSDLHAPIALEGDLADLSPITEVG